MELSVIPQKRGRSEQGIANKKEADRKAQQRRREKLALRDPSVGLKVDLQPTHFPRFPCQKNTFSDEYNEYIQKLQENSCVAKPTCWPDLFKNADERRNHRWNDVQLCHYDAAATETQLMQHIQKGLPLPILISSSSELAQEIHARSGLYNRPLLELAEKIFDARTGWIDVQDHGGQNTGEFTIEKDSIEVQNHFTMAQSDRGSPWNCLDVGDYLEGFKGPSCVDNGGFLHSWQFAKIEKGTMARPGYTPIPDAKQLDRWILISEANTASSAHVDIALGTWVGCLQGKKTFFLRNPQGSDVRVWASFGIESNHMLFEHPWGRIDLQSGDILIFPPGTVHAVYTEKDTICAGGHFLVPEFMDRFVKTLKETELDSDRTNDEKGVDFMWILRNFIAFMLDGKKEYLNVRQLNTFTNALEDYLEGATERSRMRRGKSKDSEHLKRVGAFAVQAKKERWIPQLRDLVVGMS